MEHLAATFEAAAAAFPQRPAVCMPDGTSLTYAELDERADRLAGFLQAAGVVPGDRVGLTVPKGFEAVTTVIAALKCGAAYVPSDWTAPDARGRAIMADCAVKALVLHRQCLGVLDGWADRPATVLVVGGEEVPQGCTPFERALDSAPGRRDVERHPDHLSYVLYTSGSTGVPKGVKISHRNALSFVDWCSRTFDPTPEDRFSSHAPLHFDLSILDLHVAWKHGASVHLIPDDLGRSPKELVQFAVAHDITVWYSTPSTLTFMTQFGGLAKTGWTGPRLALFAGEVFPVKHLRRLMELWTRPRWFNLYGPTETNVSTYHEVIPPIPADVIEPPPIGKPCGDHTIAMLRDAEGHAVSGAGVEGALWFTGDCVFQGYWNRPAEDARAFEMIDGRRWYDTGDLVRQEADGTLVYVGRRDRMVKRFGYRIELGEIESALYKHEGIAKVAAIATRDDKGVKIVACCVAEGETRSTIEMKQFCHEHLPSYMIPDAFAWRDDLPLTSTGKVDYQQLLRGLQPGPGTSK
ncbi:MAG: amino acid adenylation domain-containing protein [Vicinamibacterales bacterium]